MAARPPPPPVFPALSIVADSDLDLNLFPIEKAVFVLASPSYLARTLFAVAEPDGLREVPELAKGLDLGKHVQTIERLVGTWPGTLWLQTLDVDTEREPDDPDWTTRFFRQDGGGWKAVPFKADVRYPIVWTAGSRCLLGLRGGSSVKSVKRVAADCPGSRVPAVPLNDASNTYRLVVAAASPAGDVGVLEESTEETPHFRVEILGSQDPPTRSLAPIPVPAEVEANRLEFQPTPKSLLVRSATEAYLGGRLKPKGVNANLPKGSVDDRKESSIFFRFDGKAWSVLATPPLTDVPLFTVAEDGTVILVVPGSGTGNEDFALWFLSAKGAWEKRYTFRNPTGSGVSHPYQIWARTPEDIWVACSTPEKKTYRTSVVHTGEKKLVWRPTKEAAR